MKSLKIMALAFFICAASTNIFATSPLPPPFTFLFFNFEAHTEITEFTVTDYDLSATFSGGLVKDNFNTLETEDSHWVVLPAGTTTEGVSTGSALITMSPPASQIAALTLAGADAQVRVQFLDELDNVIEEHSFSNGEELDIFWVSVEGGPLASKILVLIDGGTAETAMSRFTYWDADFFTETIDDGDNGSGGIAYSLLGIFTILLGLRYWRQAAKYLTTARKGDAQVNRMGGDLRHTADAEKFMASFCLRPNSDAQHLTSSAYSCDIND